MRVPRSHPVDQYWKQIATRTSSKSEMQHDNRLGHRDAPNIFIQIANSAGCAARHSLLLPVSTAVFPDGAYTR